MEGRNANEYKKLKEDEVGMGRRISGQRKYRQEGERINGGEGGRRGQGIGGMEGDGWREGGYKWVRDEASEKKREGEGISNEWRRRNG